MILNYPLHCEAERTKENENINVNHIFFRLFQAKNHFPFFFFLAKIAFKKMNKIFEGHNQSLSLEFL